MVYITKKSYKSKKKNIYMTKKYFTCHFGR